MAAKPKEYSDPGYKGRGRIKCLNCGKPTRDHRKAGPCLFPPQSDAAREKMQEKMQGQRPRS